METQDGDYFIGGIINLYRTTGMDALIIKIDSNGTELWNMTAGGDGNLVVHSMQQTADGGLIFAGSMRNLDSEGRMAAMLMKVGKNAGTNASSNTIVGSMNGTSSVSPKQSLTAVPTEIQTVGSTEKVAGFDAVIAITILLAAYIAGRRRK